MRVFILLLDSFGVGGAPDASRFNEAKADTFGHIWERYPGLKIPTLLSLGLGHIAHLSTGKTLDGIDFNQVPESIWGCASEKSKGKDTPSGHWEIAGIPVEFEWSYFGQGEKAFPPELIERFILEAKLPGVLGEKAASGTEIIDEFGEEHIRSGKPIVYTSADSVFQIAAHEESFGLQKLYEVCNIARKLVDDYNIGRVIARPFKGKPGAFKRTGNRKDLSVLPPEKTLLDQLVANGHEVIAIGKVADIYAHQGISQEVKANGNQELFAKTLLYQFKAPKGSLVFTNFVDFDMLYGHRRDVAGYAQALEVFDKQLAEFIHGMRPDDIGIITADHGCDPTWHGSDHTRENIPIIVFGPNIKPKTIGIRESFADIGQSLAKVFGIPALKNGVSFL